MRAPGYDAGGILPTGTVHLSPDTLMPLVSLSPEQIRAYERAVELVRRWNARDNGPAQSP